MCTNAKYQKIIERHQYAEALEKNKTNLENNPQIYAQRQALVEHPFGTMKRQWGFNYIMTKKGKQRASADVGLIFIAYNITRIFNIIGLERLIHKLATIFPKDIIKSLINVLISKISQIKALNKIFIKNHIFINFSKNWIIFGL